MDLSSFAIFQINFCTRSVQIFSVCLCVCVTVQKEELKSAVACCNVYLKAHCAWRKSAKCENLENFMISRILSTANSLCVCVAPVQIHN